MVAHEPEEFRRRGNHHCVRNGHGSVGFGGACDQQLSRDIVTTRLRSLDDHNGDGPAEYETSLTTPRCGRRHPRRSGWRGGGTPPGGGTLGRAPSPERGE